MSEEDKEKEGPLPLDEDNIRDVARETLRLAGKRLLAALRDPEGKVSSRDIMDYVRTVEKSPLTIEQTQEDEESLEALRLLRGGQANKESVNDDGDVAAG